MKRLSPEEHGRLAAAIRAAEAETSGEIFVVVAAESADYRMLAILWSALLALVGGWLAPLWSALVTWWSGWAEAGPTAAALAIGQAAVFALLVAGSFVPGLRIWFVPRAVRTGRAHARAREQFLAHNIHATAARTGVLIYISLAEHHAEIVADTGIDRKVPPGFWQEIIDRLTAEIAGGRLAEGLVQAVAACGTALREHFPRHPGDENELPDRVVEI